MQQEDNLTKEPTVVNHKCRMCDNTLEEIDGKFSPESKTWVRIRVVNAPEAEMEYFCSDECYKKYFAETGAIPLNRAERRKLEREIRRKR